ncbi:MAG: 3-isopropylmalate dehydratase large subunit [Anaerolineales bacterium]|nr:3-isopropylmalate dehydratase large subunit [Anaerolineales bacterium]
MPLAQQILSTHAARPVTPGEIVIVPVDGMMATDATAPFAIKAFRDMGGTRVCDPARIALVIDHASPAPNERVANLHRMMREFAREQGIKLYDVGEGICHQLMVENGHVKAGDIFLGADSHTPTYGALGAFAVGVGSTDLAAAMLTGQVWLKVPQSILIELDGDLPPGVSAKDVILFLTGKIGADGANYEAVEFTGPLVQRMTLASRMVLANMVAEMGAKTAIIDTTGISLTPQPPLPRGEGESDSLSPRERVGVREAYKQTYSFNLSSLRPQIACPPSPDNVKPIDEVIGTKIHAAFIGSCTNSRLEDLQAAASVLRGKTLAPGIRLVIAPASRAVFNAALADGTIQTLSEAGATFIPSGCGPCVGTHQGVPGDGEVIISSTNRNFPGRMGNPKAEIYLASPAVVAAAAVAGEIVEPIFR